MFNIWRDFVIFFVLSQTPDRKKLKEFYTKISQRTATAIGKHLGTSPNKKQKKKNKIK